MKANPEPILTSFLYPNFYVKDIKGDYLDPEAEYIFGRDDGSEIAVDGLNFTKPMLMELWQAKGNKDRLYDFEREGTTI
jgi:hypothetical protein